MTPHKKNPTNADIFKAILKIEQRIGGLEEKQEQTHDQVKETNGRVTDLEKREYGRTIIEDYEAKEGVKSPKEEKDGWTTREKALIAIIMTMLAIASAVVGGLAS